MNKTRVDDLLIEMITPKVKEIEEKFTKGDGLTQEDINTLLLKSQYNRINHLDEKLDEVTADVASLKGDFKGLESKFEILKIEIDARFSKLDGDMNTKFANLETKFEEAQKKMQETIISTMKWYIGGAGVVLILLKALDIFVK